MSASPEHPALSLEGEAVKSLNQALKRREDRDKTLAVGVNQALQEKDWLTKFKRVWEDGKASSNQ